MNTTSTTATHHHIVLTEPLVAEAEEWLADQGDVIHCSSDDPEFGAHLSMADGLIVRTYTKVNAAFLAQAPRLRVVGRAGVGLDNIDLDACRERGVIVVYTPHANTGPVVEYVIAEVLERYRERAAIASAADIERWHEARNYLTAGRGLREITLGIYGFGRIGKRIAQASAGLNMPTVYHDLLSIPPDERFNASPVLRDELLRTSDVLTIHVDGRPENRHLLNADAFRLMKPDVLLINSARGIIMDAHAAAEFFKAHPDARAAIDVHDPEPFGADYPLLGLPNVKLTPHIAGRSQRALQRMSEVVYDVVGVLNRDPPKHPAT